MNFKEIGTTLVLSGALLTAPSAVTAENKKDDDKLNRSQTTELEQNFRVYDLPINIMEDFLDFETNPELEIIFNKIKANPDDTIDIEQSEIFPDITFYKIYPENTETVDKKNWSIQIAFNNDPKIKQNTEIALVIDQYLNYFNGDQKNLYREGSVNTLKLLNALAMCSDLTFNFSIEMFEAKWSEAELVAEKGNIHLVNKYRDRKGNEFEQIVRDDSVIIFKANSPLPQFSQGKFEKYPTERPIIHPDNPLA